MQIKTLMSIDEKDVSARWLVGIVDREGDDVIRTGWAETKSAGSPDGVRSCPACSCWALFSFRKFRQG